MPPDQAMTIEDIRAEIAKLRDERNDLERRLLITTRCIEALAKKRDQMIRDTGIQSGALPTLFEEMFS